MNKLLAFAIVGLLLFGCIGGVPKEVTNINIPSLQLTPSPTIYLVPTPTPDVRTAASQEIVREAPWAVQETNGVRHLIPLNTLTSFGGVDIALTKPKFVSVTDSKLLDSEPVIGVYVNNKARAYPVRIMNWHQLVNDDFDGAPVLVTYSVLTGSILAFKRSFNGEVLVFGVSEKTYANGLLFYDEETQSLWHQLTGTALTGGLAGETLERIPVEVMTLGEWRLKYNTTVLAEPTGVNARNYAMHPFGNYVSNEQIFSPPLQRDERLRAKEFVLGVGIDGYYNAYKLSTMPGILNDEFGGAPVVLLKNPANNRTKLFSRSLNNQTLVFYDWNDSVYDLQTHSKWSFNGNALRSSSFKNQSLEEIPSVTLYWFAWVQLHAQTGLVR